MKKKPNKRNEFDRPQLLWHVTSESLVSEILQDGLKGGKEPKNRDETLKRESIYTLSDPHDNLTMNVALGQLWKFQDVESYAVIEIDTAGITGRMFPDQLDNNGYHWVVEQDLIYPKFLKLSKVRTISFPGEKIADMQTPDRGRWTEEEWEIATKWLDPYSIALRRQSEDNVPVPQELMLAHMRRMVRQMIPDENS